VLSSARARSISNGKRIDFGSLVSSVITQALTPEQKL